MVKSISTGSNVFTNMPSLLKPTVESVGPESKVLPRIFALDDSSYSDVNLGSDESPRLNPLECESVAELINFKKEPKTNTVCGHLHLRHYARNMCHRCYHQRRIDKLATNCPHTSRALYARGMC